MRGEDRASGEETQGVPAILRTVGGEDRPRTRDPEQEGCNGRAARSQSDRRKAHGEPRERRARRKRNRRQRYDEKLPASRDGTAHPDHEPDRRARVNREEELVSKLCRPRTVAQARVTLRLTCTPRTIPRLRHRSARTPRQTHKRRAQSRDTARAQVNDLVAPSRSSACS